MPKYPLFIMGLLPSFLLGKPIDPQVIHGNASFQTSEHQMEIHTGKQTIINWKSFSIDHPEIVVFSQFDQNSTVLNRVTGFEGSQIFGKLLSNGNIILINPNGILFGKDSVVDTHSLIASTLDLNNSDFINGVDLLFSGNSDASVINLGTIQAKGGDLTLLGRFVKNEGRLSASEGTLTLAAGTEVLIKPTGSQRVFIAAQEFDGNPSGTGVLNSGSIDALKTHLLADGNPYDLAIRQEGKINATSLIEQGGEIYLVAEGGRVDVSGEMIAPWGEVRTLGKIVALLDEALLNTSSPKGGGNIFIGGSFQGKDSEIYSSIATFVDEKVQIKANALEHGDAGQVVVWSDGATAFYGRIESKGGPEGGNGGLVEISGKNFLDMKGIANRFAPKGDSGILLLDPSDVTISAAATTNMTVATLIQPSGTLTGCNLKNTDLTAQMPFGGVTVTTNSTNTENGDMTIIAPIDGTIAPPLASSFNLLLVTDRDLIIHDIVQNDGLGSIQCNVGRNLIVGQVNKDCRIGSTSGFVAINTGLISAPGDVIVEANPSWTAQIGCDGDPFVGGGGINLANIPGDVKVGSLSSGKSIIGHTYVGIPTLIAGTIYINSAGNTILTGASTGSGGTGPAIIGGDVYNANVSFYFTIDGNLILNANDFPAQVGLTYSPLGVSNYNLASGTTMISVDGNIILNSGTGVGAAPAQIGSDAVGVFGDMVVTAGGDITLNSIDNFTLIGPTYTKPNPQQGLSFTSNVRVEGNSVTLNGGSGGTNSFSQIGLSTHLATPSNFPVTGQGSVTVQNVINDITLNGGANPNAFALIGYGGIPRNLADAYSSTTGVKVHSIGGDINVNGGTKNLGAFAGIGYGQRYITAGSPSHSLNIDYIRVSTDAGDINLQAGSSGDAAPAPSGNNHAFIGIYPGNVTGQTTNISVGNILIDSAGSLNITGDSVGSGRTSQAMVGIMPFHNLGVTTIDINLGTGLNINAGSTPATSASTRAGIQNGTGGAFGGYINIDIANGDATLIGNIGPGFGPANIVSKGTSDLTVNQGNLFMTSNVDQAYIRNVDTTNIYALNDIVLTGNPTTPADAVIFCGGPLNVTAGDNINLINNANIENSNGLMEIIAGNDLTMTNPGGAAIPPYILNSTGDQVNIVVDNDFPTYPGIGTGALIMVPGTSISNTGVSDLLRIFTALQPLNNIQGTINGASFVPGTLYADLPPEKWETYYFDPFFHTGQPFTIFYKDGPLYIDTIQRSQVVVSEILAIELHPIDEYRQWFMEFQVAYDTECYEQNYYRGTSSYQLVPDQPYFLYLQKTFEYNPRINHLILFPKKFETKEKSETL